MATDIAGNYTFEIHGEQHRVAKMNVFQQRDFTTIIRKCMVDDGTGTGEQTVEPYTEAFNDVQDSILSYMFHRDKNGTWHQLGTDDMYTTGDYLDTMAEAAGKSQMEVLLDVTMTLIIQLSANFTSTGPTKDLTNSNHESAEPSSDTPTPNLLSKTLEKSQGT